MASSIIDGIEQIVHPNSENAQKLLEHLRLAASPSTSQIHSDIEQHLLFPPQTLPGNWLPTYQVLGGSHLSIPLTTDKTTYQTLGANHFCTKSFEITACAPSDDSDTR